MKNFQKKGILDLSFDDMSKTINNNEENNSSKNKMSHLNIIILWYLKTRTRSIYTRGQKVTHPISKVLQ